MAGVNRFHWEDDDGTLLKGSPVSDEDLQMIFDALDDEVQSINHPDVTTRSIIDNLLGGAPFFFGGDHRTWVDRDSYATGAGYDPDTILAPGSRVWKVDTALLGGNFYLEAILRTNNAAKLARLALVNLTDAPNVPMVEVTSASLTGALVRSGLITWPAPGTEKEFGVKLMTDTPQTAQANGWNYRVFRLD